MNAGVFVRPLATPSSWPQRPVAAFSTDGPPDQALPGRDLPQPELTQATRMLASEGLPQRLQAVPLGNLTHQPRLDSQGRIQLMGDQGWLALDARNLAPLDTRPLAQKSDGESVMVQDRLVYVRDEGAGLVVLRDGVEERSLPTGSPISSELLPTRDGKLLFGNDSGQVISFDPLTGATSTLVQIPGETGHKTSPLRLAPAGDGGLYVHTRDGRLFAFDAQMQPRWDRQDSYHLSWFAPTESLDGTKLYQGNISRALVALDATTGQERWRHTYVEEFGLGACGFAPVLQDEQGNVFSAALMQNPDKLHEYPEPTVHFFKFTPEGQLLFRVDTGLELRLGAGQFGEMDLDNQGNLCATAGGQLVVIGPRGQLLTRVDPQQLAGEDQLVNHMLMSPERDRLVLVCGDYSPWKPKPYSLIEVDLPGRLGRQAASEASQVRETEQGVQVGGVLIRKRRTSV